MQIKEFKYRHINSLLTVLFYNLFYLNLFYLISELLISSKKLDFQWHSLCTQKLSAILYSGYMHSRRLQYTLYV